MTVSHVTLCHDKESLCNTLITKITNNPVNTLLSVSEGKLGHNNEYKFSDTK